MVKKNKKKSQLRNLEIKFWSYSFQIEKEMANVESLRLSRIRELLIERTRKWGDIYSNLSESLTNLVNDAIDHPILDDDLNDLETIVDKPHTVINPLDEHIHLTEVNFDQFQNHQFLRGRIREILSTDLEPVNQRLLIQHLMSRSYKEKIKHDDHQHQNLRHHHHNHESDIDDDEVILNDIDKTPTFFNESEGILGCEHYQRNCKIECFTCRKWFTCRFCHDLEIKDHQLERNQIKHILCMYCNTPQQPSDQNDCSNCGKLLSKYVCSICKLYDNDNQKDIYHCEKCGICRLGLGLNKDYFHCDQCNACISISLLNSHICIENSTKSNCPICDEYLFTTSLPVIFMSCGHPIHELCFNQHSNHDYKCPICKKTVLNMEVEFRMMDKEITNSIMPDDCKNWKSIVKCCDCDGWSNVDYHYIGHKCDHCKSYNTMVIKIIKSDDDNDLSNLMSSNLSSNSMAISNSLDQNFQFEKIKEMKIRERSGTIHSQGSDLEIWGNNPRLSNNNNNNTDKEREGEIGNENNNINNNDNNEEDNTKKDGADEGNDDLVNNFIRVINNFETYSNISEAFKDWITTSMPWEDDDEKEEEEEEEEDYVDE